MRELFKQTGDCFLLVVLFRDGRFASLRCRRDLTVAKPIRLTFEKFS